jgi:hypothetical protein
MSAPCTVGPVRQSAHEGFLRGRRSSAYTAGTTISDSSGAVTAPRPCPVTLFTFGVLLVAQ